MIEMAMIFILGFLVAAGIAAALWPIVWRQAAHVTARRFKSAAPRRWVEFQAVRDQLRAANAVAVRRVEVDAEACRTRLADQRALLGRRTSELAALRMDVDAKTHRVAELEEAKGTLESSLATKSRETETLTAALAEAESLAGERKSVLDQQTREFDLVATQADGRRVEIVALKTKIERLKDDVADLAAADRRSQDQIAALEAAERDATTALERAERERDDARTILAGAETRLQTANAKLAGLERERSTLHGKASERAAEILRLEGLLASQRERGEVIAADFARLKADIEERRSAGESTGERLQAEIAVLRHEKTKLEEERRDLREQVSRLSAELARRGGEDDENARLKQQIDQLAGDVLRLHAAPNERASGDGMAHAAQDGRPDISVVAFDGETVDAAGGSDDGAIVGTMRPRAIQSGGRA